MRLPLAVLSSCAAAVLAVGGEPALAAEPPTSACRPIAGAFCPSLALGAFVPASGGPSGGLVLSTTIPHLPTAYDPRMTLALPLDGDGRFGVTAEARTVGRNYAGVGAGYGRLGSQHGMLVDLVGGTRLTPLTAIEARFYGGGGANGAVGFVGLRFGF